MVNIAPTLRVSAHQVLLQEIPGHVSLSLLISGCPLRCAGCHSADSWNPNVGEPLTETSLLDHIHAQHGFLTCVLFLGGEWHAEALRPLLKLCKAQGLATALYTGLDHCPPLLRDVLDFVKTGAWRKELGGLASKETNQRLVDLTRGLCLNPLFWEPAQAPFAVNTNQKV